MIPNINAAINASSLAASPSVSSEGSNALGSSNSIPGLTPGGAGSSQASLNDSQKSIAALKDPEKAKALTERVNALLPAESNVVLRFDLGENHQVRSFQLVDKDTNKVVMQYPSEEALHLRDRLEAAAEKAQPSASQSSSSFGLLLSTKA